MNEMLSAPLLASQKDSPDWEDSINAITRHAIEEFSNLQFFVPTLYEKCTKLGMAGINWIPTLGTWMQFNNKTAADPQTISFYKALSTLAAKQVDVSNTTYGQAVKQMVQGGKNIYQVKTDLASAAVVAKSQATYVPISNAVTKAAYEQNAANGAHPEADITLRGVVSAMTSQAAAGSSSGSSSDGSSSKGNWLKGLFNGARRLLGFSH